MLHRGNRCGLAVAVAGAVLAAALLGLGSGKAGLFQPQLIDANTGDDALDVGASFGSKQGWAGLVQPPTGTIKFYVAHAQEGVFAAPQPVDTEAVTSAALAGNGNGGAVAVYTKKIGLGLVSALFARRLSGGQLGQALQVSTDTQNVNLLKVHRLRQVAENDAGVAAVCYVDNLLSQAWAAVLRPSDLSWTRYGPLKSKSCDDIAVDAAGDVIVLGDDDGSRASTDRIVGGVLQPGEEVDSTAKDEPSLAVFGSSALVLARIDASSGGFNAAAWRMNNIATDNSWTSLGPIDGGVLDAQGNVEFARAAVASNGKGIVTFRIGHPGTQTSTNYYEAFDASTAAPIGQPHPLTSEGKIGDVTPIVDGTGNGLASWTDSNGTSEEQHVRSFAPGAPSQDVILPGSSLNATTSFEADSVGDFLAVVERGVSPVRVAAFFADFVKPTLAPSASSPTPIVARPVQLHSGAGDSFGPITAVRWHFPAGSIIGDLDLTGADVTVTPATVGAVTARLTATDKGGNTGTGRLVLKMKARAKLRVTPGKVKKRARIRLRGTGFAPDKAVVLVLMKGSKVRARLGFGLPNEFGGFSRRVPLGKKTRAGRYVVRACQLRCRIKATARLRIR